MSVFLGLAHTFTNERQRWPLWIPVGMAVGIISYFALSFEPPAWFLLASPLLAVALFGLRYVWWTGAVLGFVVLLGVIGFNAAQLETRMDARPMLDREIGPVPIEGRLMLTEIMPDGVRITLKDPTLGHLPPEQTPEKIRIRLNDVGVNDLPATGAKVSLLGRVGAFSEPVVPGANDFRRQAFFRHLGGLGWAYGAVKLVEADPPSRSWRDSFNLAFERARMTLAQHVNDRLNGDVAAMTIARLNGQQTGISKPVIEAMRIAGLAHLLSTSGFSCHHHGSADLFSAARGTGADAVVCAALQYQENRRARRDCVGHGLYFSGRSPARHPALAADDQPCHARYSGRSPRRADASGYAVRRARHAAGA